MIHLADRSGWTFDTSGSGGFSIDVFAAEGGVVKLFDPPHKTDPKRAPIVFRYGGVGAGISTPGLKIPKLGNVIARQLAGRALNGAASATTMWNEGWIFKTPIVGARELVRDDFVGACILAEIGISTPIKGRTGSMFLVGIDPMSLAMATSPPLMLAELILGRGAPLSPRAVIFVYGDSRGLVAGGTGYIGYMR